MAKKQKFLKRCGRYLKKKSPLFRKVSRNLLNRKKRKVFRQYAAQETINDKQIVFEAYQGDSYACSPKAIYEYMIQDERFRDYKMIWAFKGRALTEVPGPAISVARGSEAHYRACAGARYFICNTRIPDYIDKRPGQILVQCWHGTPLKRLGYDIVEGGGGAINNNKDIQKRYASDAKQFDYLLSPSRFCTEKLRSAFYLEHTNPTVKLIEEGYPRNDFLFNYTKEDEAKIKESIGIPADDKRRILLYAPTWRDNQYTAGKGYVYKLQIDLERWNQQLSQDYILLCKLHTLVAKSVKLKGYEGFVYDVSGYGDITELYVISDMLITDYSSAFFDYANLKRPIFFYMYDLDEYRDQIRGFYLDLEELPGKIIEKEDDLINAIVEGHDTYDDKYQRFHDKFNYLDDGHAAERVIERVFFNPLQNE